MIETYRPSLSEIEGEVPWSAAEERLLEACGAGKVAWFGNERPTKEHDENTIRAGLIRHILLGGCDEVPVHAKGVQILGAWVTDVLDLEACESSLDLALVDCRICEQPNLQDARLGAVMLPGSSVPGLNAHRLKVTRGLQLNQGFKAQCKVNLSNADIGGQLACSDGRFDGAGDVAMNCSGMTVGASVLLSEGFSATGQVNLMRTQIAGQLACVNGSFDGGDAVALNCDAMKVAADVYLRDGFTAKGQVNLRGAQIMGQLSCNNGIFDGAGSVALLCDRMTVGGSVLLCDEFSATGQVNLRGAQITGQFSCVNGTFNGAGGVALVCEAMTVGADAFLRDGFTAMGQVNLIGAKVAGSLQFMNAEFKGDLDCEGMTVGGGMYWGDVMIPPSVIDLTDAHVGALRDDVGSWERCLPVLDGFRYERMIGDISVRERLAWLAGKYEQPIKAAVELNKKSLPWARGVGKAKFDPQPYSQLAKVLREQGNANGAARVLVVREKRQRRATYWRAQAGLDGQISSGLNSILTTITRPFDGLFGLVFGYGHRPMRAFGAVFLIWLSCYWLYGAAYDAGQMAPNSDVVLTSDEWLAAAEEGCAMKHVAGCEMPLHLWQATDTATDYETFNRGLYALDLFVPLDALGQENAWAPSKDRGDLGWWAYYMRWVVQMAGWVITAVGAAALTGVIGRKE